MVSSPAHQTTPIQLQPVRNDDEYEKFAADNERSHVTVRREKAARAAQRRRVVMRRKAAGGGEHTHKGLGAAREHTHWRGVA
jgi:hypothetical protein